MTKPFTPVKVCLIHNIISPYRLPIFESIQQSGQANLTVLFCKPITKDRQWEYNLQKSSFRWHILPNLTFGPLIINYTALWRLLRTDFDVVIVNSDPDVAWIATTAKLVAQIRRKKLIIWSEVIDPNLRFFAKLAYGTQAHHRAGKSFLQRAVLVYRRFMFRGADGFIAFCKRAENFLLENGVPQPHITRTIQVMPPALLPNPTVKKIGKEPVILYVGQLTQLKGVNYLIAAFQGLNHPTAQLWLVGTGPEEQALRKLAGPNKNINFHGYVAGVEKANTYARADIFAFPSLGDCWGLVINEAVHYGLDVVCSSAAGAAELVEESHGIVVPPSDAKSLQKALASFLNHTHKKPAIRPIDPATDTEQCAKDFINAINASMQEERV